MKALVEFLDKQSTKLFDVMNFEEVKVNLQAIVHYLYRNEDLDDLNLHR